MALLSSCQVTYTAHNCTWLFFGSLQCDLEEYKTPFSTKPRQSSVSCKESLSLSVKHKALKWAIIVRKEEKVESGLNKWIIGNSTQKNLRWNFSSQRFMWNMLVIFFFIESFKQRWGSQAPVALTVLKISTNWLIYYSFIHENFEHRIYLHTKGWKEVWFPGYPW